VLLVWRTSDPSTSGSTWEAIIRMAGYLQFFSGLLFSFFIFAHQKSKIERWQSQYSVWQILTWEETWMVVAIIAISTTFGLAVAPYLAKTAYGASVVVGVTAAEKGSPMNLSEGLMIAAIVLSPLVALTVDRWRQRNDRRKQREQEVLYGLVRGRSALRDPHCAPQTAQMMEQALNAIPIVFSRYEKITSAHCDFYEAKRQEDEPAVQDQKLIALILHICRHMGYTNVDEESISRVLYLR